MKIVLAVAVAVGLSISGRSGAQDDKRTLTDLTNVTHGTLYLAAGNPNQVLMTCESAGDQPEDYYDCKLVDGHSLSEVMRIVLRTETDQRSRCTKEKMNILSEWKKHNEELLRSLPHPIPQDKKDRS